MAVSRAMLGQERREHDSVGLVEAYSMGTGGFKELASGASTGFDVGDYMAKLRVNSDRLGDSYQELELKLGYTEEGSDETYLGLTDEDFGRNPLARYPASGADLMEADHSQIQIRHFWGGRQDRRHHDRLPQ